MSKNERILLDFAYNLRNNKPIEYETENLIEALESGAQAISAVCTAQEAAKQISEIFIDKRFYKKEFQHE